MKRYQQQIILPEIGIVGQEQISAATVLVVGAGGLGSIVVGYLAAMGIGNIGICDFDSIEETNLHRQFFYSPDDMGKNKSKVLAQKLQVQNPDINIKAIDKKINKSNSKEIFNDYQIICDCTDNVETRLLLNECSAVHNLPLIHGAVSDWQGYITVFNYKEKYNYSDLFESKDLLNSQSCIINGINSTICGIIGSHMANETIKVILKFDSVLEGKLLYINTLNNTTKYLVLKKN